ncbi:MAG: tetratricopeptide repeat protein [Bryobacterales bacterium]|nr:tetratricopeptide repeat protein [Bryobacterales bacterium]
MATANAKRFGELRPTNKDLKDEVTLPTTRRHWFTAALRLLLLSSIVSIAALAQTAGAFGPRLLQAKALFNKGDYSAAAEGFTALTESYPDKPEPWWYLGIVAFQKGEADTATVAFEKLSSLQPERGAGWVMLGLSEFRARRFDPALVHIEQGRFLGGLNNPQIEQLAKLTQAMLCTRIGRFDVALAVLSELAIANVRTSAVVATFGLAALNRAVLLDEVSAADQRLVMEAGQAAWLIAAKQTEQSIAEAEALLQRYPAQSGLHAILATALLRNDRQRSEREFRAELAANPGHFFANVTLASELLEQNRNEDALPFANQAARLVPDRIRS